MKQLDHLQDLLRDMDSQTRLRWGIGIAVVLFLAIVYSYLSGTISSLSRKRVAREADLAELMLLKQRYLNLKKESERLANRLASVKADDSPGRVMEEAGFKGKPVQIRPLKGEERGGLQEELAEVKVDGLTANEAVNLLHRLEKGTKPVILRKLAVKTRFDDPSRVDLTLTVALVRSTAPGKL